MMTTGKRILVIGIGAILGIAVLAGLLLLTTLSLNGLAWLSGRPPFEGGLAELIAKRTLPCFGVVAMLLAVLIGWTLRRLTPERLRDILRDAYDLRTR